MLNSRDITLQTKVHLVKAMVFPVVMYGCESCTALYQEASVVASGAQKIPTAKWQKLQQQFFSANRVRLNRYANKGTVLFSKTIAKK